MARIVSTVLLGGLLVGCPKAGGPPPSPGAPLLAPSITSALDLATLVGAGSAALAADLGDGIACVTLRAVGALASEAATVGRSSSQSAAFGRLDVGALAAPCVPLLESPIGVPVSGVVEASAAVGLQLVRLAVGMAGTSCEARVWTDATTERAERILHAVVRFVEDPTRPAVAVGPAIPLATCHQGATAPDEDVEEDSTEETPETP